MNTVIVHKESQNAYEGGEESLIELLQLASYEYDCYKEFPIR